MKHVTAVLCMFLVTLISVFGAAWVGRGDAEAFVHLRSSKYPRSGGSARRRQCCGASTGKEPNTSGYRYKAA